MSDGESQRQSDQSPGFSRIWSNRVGETIEFLAALGGVVMAVTGVLFLVFSDAAPEDTRAGKILALVEQNWHGALILLAPLFYQSVRQFVMQRQREPEGENQAVRRAEEQKNPPTRRNPPASAANPQDVDGGAD